MYPFDRKVECSFPTSFAQVVDNKHFFDQHLEEEWLHRLVHGEDEEGVSIIYYTRSSRTKHGALKSNLPLRTMSVRRPVSGNICIKVNIDNPKLQYTNLQHGFVEDSLNKR